jgi:molecular chaperone GrpE
MSESKSGKEEVFDSLDGENVFNESVDAAFSDAMDGNPSPEDTVAAMEQQLAELKDRELKAQAELENFRKRILRDTEQTLKYASLPLVRDVLEVNDNLSRAAEAAQTSSDSESLLAGVRMVQQQLKGVLEKYNCRAIEALGKTFDPNIHQAIAQAPSTEYPAGTVSLEASVGYMMHDRVIRPSHVIVSTGNG